MTTEKTIKLAIADDHKIFRDGLRTSLKDELLMLSDKKFIEEQNIFNYNQIVPLIHNHINNKVDNTFRVWTYYCFQKWYKFLYS